MSIKIDKPIIDYGVVKTKPADRPEPAATDTPNSEPIQSEIPTEQTDQTVNKKSAAATPAAENKGAMIVQLHEKVARPEMLIGSTYKVKTPLSDHALYVTINDIVLNPDTPYENRRPFEVFINSKNMDHFQWIVALTRIISAVFRKGGDVTFLVEELRSVFDPKGGYFKRGGKFMPSLVAEIGDAIESHMKMIGMIKHDELDVHQQSLIAEKRREFDARVRDNSNVDNEQSDNFPKSARLCVKCTTKAVILMDGCMTCLNCGDSKCG